MAPSIFRRIAPLALASTLIAAQSAAAQLPEDSALQTRLPEGLRGVCATTAAAPGAVAASACDPSATEGVSAIFQRFASHAAAGAHYGGLLAQSGVSGISADTGDCPARLPSEGTWFLGAYPVGRLACFIDGAGAATMIWTHTPSGIVAVARRADGRLDQLVSWWTDNPIPGVEVEARLSGVGLFPDPFELRLLVRLPAAVATTCERPEDPVPRGPRGVRVELQCNGPRAWRSSAVYYTQFGTAAGAEAFYRQSTRALGLTRGMGTRCDRMIPSEGTYVTGGRVRGRVGCIRKGGYANVLWVDRRLKVVGLAIRRGADVRSVVRWWSTTG